MPSVQHVKKFFVTFVYVLFVIITQFWQALGIVAIAVINKRPFECIFIFLGFVIGRKFFGNSYHASSLWLCTLITWTVFYVLTASVPSFHVSMTLPSIFGLILAYILSLIPDILKERNDTNDT